jgi:hypothetical protein
MHGCASWPKITPAPVKRRYDQNEGGRPGKTLGPSPPHRFPRRRRKTNKRPKKRHAIRLNRPWRFRNKEKRSAPNQAGNDEKQPATSQLRHHRIGTRHSDRNATIGSTAVARRAGI